MTGATLIRDLLADPRKFHERGSAYDLLQAYFAGFPLETLRPLLESSDPFIQRVAVFVVSELGVEAQPLLGDVLPLLSSEDRYLQYHAMEIAAVCCEGKRASEFAHVVLQLENRDRILRVLAMRLISNADISQLIEARQRLASEGRSGSAHEAGLRVLTAGDAIESGVLTTMIQSADPVLRRYGAIAAKRLLQKAPGLMDEVACSADPDLQGFHEATVRSDPDDPVEE